MVQVIFFTVGTLVILWFSRRSLRRFDTHGFPRFFAFEAVLGLVVLNLRYWFVEPFTAQHLASWCLLAISLIMLIWGVTLLRRLGKTGSVGANSANFEWENTGQLVTTGVFRYIRHPMYSSLLFLAWGTLLKDVTISTFGLAVVASAALFVTARFEELENIRRFGSAYHEYMKATHRFVPFLF